MRARHAEPGAGGGARHARREARQSRARHGKAMQQQQVQGGRRPAETRLQRAEDIPSSKCICTSVPTPYSCGPRDVRCTQAISLSANLQHRKMPASRRATSRSRQQGPLGPIVPVPLSNRPQQSQRCWAWLRWQQPPQNPRCIQGKAGSQEGYQHVRLFASSVFPAISNSAPSETL